MTEFIVGLVLGGIVGVVLDRLWSYYEGRTRLELTAGGAIKEHGEKVFCYTVRNVGSTEAPEHKIAIFHPDRGSLYVLLTKQSGGLLPDQKRVHECVLLRNEVPDQFIRRWIEREKGVVVEDVKFEKFSLRVVMVDSERILFESSTMGNAIAKDWYQSVVDGNWGASTWHDHNAMSTRPSRRLKYWLERRKEKREFAKVLAEHKNSVK